MNSKKIIFIIVLVIVLAIVGGLAFWRYGGLKNNNQVSNGQSINPTDYLVYEIKATAISDFQKERFFERFNKAKSTISENGQDYKNDKNFYAWLEVASVQKAIGDYSRAEKIWQWFNEAYPGNSISPANLGDLYKSFKIDNEQSEKYYKMAIEREQHDFNIYYGFYELYRYNFKDSDKAVAILKDGLKNNPDDAKYVNELIDYLVSLGAKDKALEVANEYIATHPESAALRNKIK